MNCVEAQKLFADLLDHSRDERPREVSDHLAACPLCRQELAALAESQRLVSALPPVEPPPGFTTRVMAEVRDAAGRPSVWQRLFSPTQSLPLQTAAVILISVLAVLIYQKESVQRQSTTIVPPPSGIQKQAEADKMPPRASGAPGPESRVKKPDASGAQEIHGNPSFQSEHPRSPAKPEERSKTIGRIDDPGARNTAPPSESGNPSIVAPSRPKEESPSADQAGSVRSEQSLRFGGAQAKGVPSSAPLHDSPSSAGLEEKRAGSSLDALGSSSAVFSDRDVILRLKQSERGDSTTHAPPQLEHFQLEASPLRTILKDLDGGWQRTIQTGQPQTLSTVIDAREYDGFKKELARLGKIESDTPAPANQTDPLSKSSGRLRIRITILPPLPSADSLPTQPSSP